MSAATYGESIELDIDRVAANLAARPRVREDLKRIRMATPTELVGSFASSKQTIYSSSSFLVDEPRRAAPTRIDSDASERRQAIERSTFLQLLLPKLTGGPSQK